MRLFDWLMRRFKPATTDVVRPAVDLGSDIAAEQRQRGRIYCDRCNRDVPVAEAYAWPKGRQEEGRQRKDFVTLCLELDSSELLEVIQDAGPAGVKELMCRVCIEADTWYRHRDSPLFGKLLEACRSLAERHLRADGRWRNA